MRRLLPVQEIVACILIMLLCLFIACLPLLAMAQERQVAYVASPNPLDRLSLRKEASSGSEPLGKYYSGTIVEVLGKQDGYALVQVGAMKGFMRSEYLADSPVTWTQGQWYTVEETQPLLSAPGAEGESLAQLPNGTTVLLLGEEGSWLHVRQLEMDGYMQKEGLRPDESETYPVYAKLTGGRTQRDAVRLCAYPSRNAPLLGEYPMHTEMEIYGRAGVWYAVRMDDGQVGFVLSQYIEDIKYRAADAAEYAVVAMMDETNCALLYDTGSTAGAVLDRCYNGTQMRVLSREDGWAHVQIGAMQGYMRERDIQIMEPTSLATK